MIVLILVKSGKSPNTWAPNKKLFYWTKFVFLGFFFLQETFLTIVLCFPFLYKFPSIE